MRKNNPVPHEADGKPLPGLCSMARELTLRALEQHLSKLSYMHALPQASTITPLGDTQVTEQVEGTRSPKTRQSHQHHAAHL